MRPLFCATTFPTFWIATIQFIYYCPPDLTNHDLSHLHFTDRRVTVRDDAAATIRTTSTFCPARRASLPARAEFVSMVSEVRNKYLMLLLHWILLRSISHSRSLLSLITFTAFASGYTDAATVPTCFFGLFNQADDGGEIPDAALDDPTVGDSNEGGPVVIQPVIEPEPEGCKHNGINFPPGQAYTNRCNSCQCASIGLAACTLMACDDSMADCMFNGMAYWDGEKFMDDCNTCTCMVGSNGPTVSCTLRACPPPVSPGK